MIRYIRQYPVSICIILAVIYLSFFKPPQTDIGYVVAGVHTRTPEDTRSLVARLDRRPALPRPV